MELSLRYDMNSPPFGAPHKVLYRTAIEQAVWADNLGFNTVYLAEHHGAEHGYCPSSMIHGASILGATKQIQLHLSVVLVTLHNPLRLAEDLAVLDNLSDGRVVLTAGMAYRPHEFEMFGIDMSKRLSVLNYNLEVMKKAWTGELFEYEGRQVRVTPRPVQPNGPRIFMGGSTEKSALRAGRGGYEYRPGHPALFDVYQKARIEAGHPLAEVPLKSAANFLYVTEDPGRDWPLLLPHIGYATNTYAEWAKERGTGVTTYEVAMSDEQLKNLPIFKVLTPDQCFDYVLALGPDTQLTFHALMGGLDPDVSWRGLRLFEKKVLPRLREAGMLTPNS